MSFRYKGWLWILLPFGVAAGCGQTHAPPAGTGAKEAVQGYYEALIKQDWAAAYATLDPDSQKRHSPEQFTRLAQQYRRGLSLEPHAVHVRSCEEHGAEAIAHVTLAGPGAAGKGQYRDAVTVRHTGLGWRVMLPPNFGQAQSR